MKEKDVRGTNKKSDLNAAELSEKSWMFFFTDLQFSLSLNTARPSLGSSGLAILRTFVHTFVLSLYCCWLGLSPASPRKRGKKLNSSSSHLLSSLLLLLKNRDVPRLINFQIQL